MKSADAIGASVLGESAFSLDLVLNCERFLDNQCAGCARVYPASDLAPCQLNPEPCSSLLRRPTARLLAALSFDSKRLLLSLKLLY